MQEVYSHELSFWQKFIGIWRINSGSIDFTWGYFAHGFGFEFILNRGGYFNSSYSMTFCLIWGTLNIRLPFKTKLKEGCDLPRYGIAIHNGTFWIYTGGDFDESIGQVTGNSWITWDLPYFTWNHDSHEVRSKDGDWSKMPDFDDRDSVYTEEHPYMYKLRSGEVQKRIAKIYVNRRTWYRKWFPFLKMVKTSIDVSFNDEVGEETGSWKGGTVGCGYDMMPNETMKETLHRMEKERKFN